MMDRASGYTAIEILVATCSALLTLAALTGVFRLHGRLNNRESRALALRESSRRVLEMMVREVRGAGFEPLVGGSFDAEAEGVSVAGGNFIEIRSDRHGSSATEPPDGTIDLDSDERVAFFNNVGRRTIYQSVGQQILPLTSSSEILAPPEGLELRYFDSCGRELVLPAGGELSDADRPRVRRIAIVLRLDAPGGSDSISAQAVAALRNRPSQCEETN